PRRSRPSSTQLWRERAHATPEGDSGEPARFPLAPCRAFGAVRRKESGVTQRVLVREAIAPAGVDLLRSRFDVDEDSDSDLAEIIDRYDAIVVRSATKLTAELIGRAARLR